MIASLEVFLILLGITAPLYWACAGRFEGLRLPLLVFASMAMLFTLSPLIPLFVLGYYVAIRVAWSMCQRGRIQAGRLKSLAWLSFLPLLTVEFLPAELAVRTVLGESAAVVPGIVNWAYLGLSYTAIRAFLILRQAKARDQFGSGEALAALTFFASFAAGPIASAGPFAARASRLTLDAGLRGASRIGWGLFLLLLAAPALQQVQPELESAGAVAWFDVFRSFLVLYLNFAGYTDVALGAAMLFGVSMPENFRLPLLARSVQDFWRRWHLSLAGFIGDYLFKPLVRAYGRPVPAIFCAFVLVGLWHEISWTYLIWGVGHGGALAVQMAWNKRKRQTPSRASALVTGLAGWTFTLSYVAILSAVANSSSLAAAGTLLMTLTGAMG